ncbi:hypothetical protein [uncultured Kordia sp.]|uniref:hypothetical protein n=1 Tax=uncultured Kordia sp. TaxID=507699 RepID=UPI002613A00F|nr:hypothetical protein [uncultured Kordia sp.]
MAETSFVPLDKKAKGKSNIFKFVTLRNPESVNPEEASKQLIYHPDISVSAFVPDGADAQKKGSYSSLSKVAATFIPIDSVENVKAINQDLYSFADWLFRNRNTVDATASDKIKSLDILTQAQRITVWDNLFYYVIKNESPYIRESLLMLLIADNFVKKLSALVKTDTDAKMLASASIVIPKLILSKPQKVVQENANTIEKSLSYNTIDEDEINDNLKKYEIAITELQEVNRLYIDELSKVDISSLEKTVEPNTDGDDVMAYASVSKQDIIASVGNPLAENELQSKVSADTFAIAKELQLSRFNDPVKAISIIEEEMIRLSANAFSNKSLTKKQKIVGGSIIEYKENSSSSSTFQEGCFPTIVDQVGIFAGTISSTVDPTLASNFIRSTVSGIGNAGGASEEVMADYGSLSFSISKVPSGRGYYVGLSAQNTDANINSIKYAIRVNSRFDSTTSASTTIARAYINGVSTGDFIKVKSGDQLKIARVDTIEGTKIVFSRYRPSTGLLSLIHKADDLSPTTDLEPLLLDFAFTSADQIFHSIYFDPCGGSSGSGDGDGEPGSTDAQCSGVKNLGISDYMRVEQEICCYTPGEVSHIENILQGEYKERSTRRLRRQETTTTFESENTTEKLRDTTTTDRYEMEQESASVIQEDTAFDVGVTATSKLGPVNLTVDSGFATSTSTTDSNSQAVSYAKEVSSRALDRVVNRVREERITKVIEEFEENNLHGLDNRSNSEGHVTGIYRWVDKIYKNQVVNYGKRMTYEFMIPEPAKFHLWAMANGDVANDFEAPEDPREHGLPNHESITEENYAQWASAYDTKVSPPPAKYIEVMEGYAETPDSLGSFSKSYNSLQLPEDYILESIELDGSHAWNTDHASKKFISMAVADEFFSTTSGFKSITGYKQKSLPISLHASFISTYFFNVTAKLTRKSALLDQWKIDTFAKIMEAYQQKKAAYENAIAEAKAQASLGIQIQGNNPLYNRMTEKEELKKSCLNWLEVSIGNGHYGTTSPCEDVTDMPQMQTTENLACYAQKAKFFEQAFDWDIMTYLFYPYFWGQKCNWKEIYKLDDNDHIFRGFLQAGMARVVVPVKPNYEAAVMYYIETGEVWNGGEVPVPGDPLYESVLTSLEDQEPTPVGDAWETRVPTSLNILQKDAGAIDGDGLPCNCDDYTGDGTGGSTLSGNANDGVGNFIIS